MTSVSSSESIVRRGAVAVICRDGRFLVIRRSQSVRAPGRYCFPGGGIEPGESEEQAMVREFREELGAHVRPVARLWECITPWGVWLAWWQAEFLPGESPLANPAEVESIHWHTAAELASLEGLLESNLAFLSALASGHIALRSDGD